MFQKTLFFSFYLIINSLSVFSQEDSQIINGKTLSQQFEYLTEESEKYKRYHLVPTKWIELVKNNTIDTLLASKNKLIDKSELIKNQDAELTNLQKQLANLEIANKKVNTTSLLGLEVSKIVHLAITYSLFILLILMILLFTIRSKKNRTLNKKTQAELTELEKEFENHRRVAIEREQKVRRQLQDELNKSK